MEFELTDFDISGDRFLKTEKDGKSYLVRISKEALTDNLEGDLKNALEPDKRKKLERKVIDRIASNSLVRMNDRPGSPRNVILIVSGDLK